ncbi:DUF4178 domain-containing protein [Hymenobacter aquaticus]|uniref:DUF4178 domain-containing protein n=1 Tax=Hymenobacter aquaticus TaxID=1867101 RepID=A0A4Z0Q8G5_9BACT|nr:DUF4178 domain-containing protein [Hymenobacter aquaticus]TGE25361.1 DUF4178 domain-containing protein [Hymenobacter aquaticus]
MSELATTLEAHLSCPSCAKLLTYYDAVNSTHFACPQCHTLFAQTAKGATEKVRQFQDVPRLAPCLPLGSIGTLPDGLLYRVTGYMLRKEKSTPARWQEFMLFNPTAGYAQLSLYEGHWMFIRPTQEEYKGLSGRSGNHRVVLDGDTTFSIYNKYQPQILYATGEFDWNILDDERLTITEFVAPPRMLIEEKAKGRAVEWYRAEHIEPGAVARAFAVPMSRIPFRTGVGAVQPAPGGDSWPALKQFTILLLLLVLVTEMVFGMIRPHRQLLRESFASGPTQSLVLPAPAAAAATATTEKVLVSMPFEVPDSTTSLQVEVRADLDNSWLELPVSLVNEQTGRGFEFTKNIEYYHGYESGESWSEGSVEADALLTRIPAGRYHLNLYPASENNRPVSFTVTVTENPWLPSNLLLLVLGLLLYPGILIYRRQQHEQSRWEQSDYTP